MTTRFPKVVHTSRNIYIRTVYLEKNWLNLSNHLFMPTLFNGTSRRKRATERKKRRQRWQMRLSCLSALVRSSLEYPRTRRPTNPRYQRISRRNRQGHQEGSSCRRHLNSYISPGCLRREHRSTQPPSSVHPCVLLRPFS